MKEQALATGVKCPECGQGQLLSFHQDEEFDFDLGNETVKVHAENVPVEKCDTCGEEMSGPAAAKVRHEAICRAADLLPPSEIKAVRESFGWSQQYLADLTGLGIATVSRLERGRHLQNRANNNVLLALRDCPAFREYLERLLTSKTAKPESGTTGNGGSLPQGAPAMADKNLCGGGQVSSNRVKAYEPKYNRENRVANAEKAKRFELCPCSEN